MLIRFFTLTQQQQLIMYSATVHTDCFAVLRYARNDYLIWAGPHFLLTLVLC